MDDARMAPVNWNHFDGYLQGPGTLTRFRPGECVPGLCRGGWHDAGDFDLRVESQSGEAYLLALTWEAFRVEWDSTSIDQKTGTVEIHHPDGKNDLLEQIEHGALAVLGGWKALGRLYRGIIASSLRQYVMLGDAAAMTDGVPGDEDDRWVFTENNPHRQFMTAGHLAAASRALKGFNDELAKEALQAAIDVYDNTVNSDQVYDNIIFPVNDPEKRTAMGQIHGAVELFLTTGEEKYKEHIIGQVDFITENIKELGWIVCRGLEKLADEAFTAKIREAMVALKDEFVELSKETPYGIPYRPHIWGAGWMIQRMGFQYYYLHKAFPEIFEPELMMNALNFILGCHPGSNTASFASGVGAKSATSAYGLNRADWSYIPGGVVSGTALIRPDFPELLEFPFLWQQTEYVLGGGSSDYMFLVLAVQQVLKK